MFHGSKNLFIVKCGVCYVYSTLVLKLVTIVATWAIMWKAFHFLLKTSPHMQPCIGTQILTTNPKTIWHEQWATNVHREIIDAWVNMCQWAKISMVQIMELAKVVEGISKVPNTKNLWCFWKMVPQSYFLISSNHIWHCEVIILNLFLLCERFKISYLLSSYGRPQCYWNQ